MNLNTADEHGLIFVLTTDGSPALPDSYVRKGELLAAIEHYVVNNLAKFDAHNFIDYEDVAKKIFEICEDGECIVSKDTPITGKYYKFIKDNFGGCINNYLLKSPIFEISRDIGARYFSDTFAVIEERVVDGSYDDLDVTEDVLSEVEVAVPAADRIVRLDHNQVSNFDEQITELVNELETQDNGDPDQPGLRERLLGQIKAGRELIRVGEFKAYLLYEVLVRALGELVQKYGNPTVKSLADALLGAIVSQILEGN